MKQREAMETVVYPDNAENNGQLKDNNKDIESKVARILKLIKNNGQDKKGKILEDSKKKSELIGLIHEFHKQYQSLYAKHDNLRGEMAIRALGGKKEKANASLQSSDSEYYSSEDIENGALMNGHYKSSDNNNAELGDSDGPANLKYMTAFGKSPRMESTKKDQKNKANDRKREPSTLVKVQEAHGSQFSAEIKELEVQLNALRMEMESLRCLKNDLELQIEERDTEARQFGERNVKVHSKISELGNEISEMTTKMKESEKNSTSRIQILATQVKDLQLEIDLLQAEKYEIEGGKKKKGTVKFKGLKDQAKDMQRELESLRKEKSEFQLQLDRKTKKIAEHINQMEAMKDEIQKKSGEERGFLKEKERFVAEMDELKLEVSSLHDKNKELQEMVKSRNKETDELREENDRLQDKISELEKDLADKENQDSNQIRELKSEANSLKQELNSLVGEKGKLEEQNDRLKQDCKENKMQVENEILNLTSKIEDQEKTLKEKDDTIKKISEQRKLIKHHSLDSPIPKSTDSPKFRATDSPRLNNSVFERKIDELAEKFRMKMENHIRLLSRRIQVAEQLHSETRDGYKNVFEQLEQEKKELVEKKAAYESELKKIKNALSESGNNMMTGWDIMMKKIEDENVKFSERISGIANEFQDARDCLPGGKTEDIQNLGTKNASEKMNADRKVRDLEQKVKEREEILTGLAEEKREAIRQLCILIDYHRQRYDNLKSAVAKMPFRFRKAY